MKIYKMLKKLNLLLTVPVSDPQDARRRKMLNILLLGIFLSAFLGLIVFGIDSITAKNLVGPGVELVWLSIIVFMIGSLIIYYINRYSGRSAAYVFLIFLTIAFSFSDTPDQVANGRSLFVYTLPIVIASVILYPGASFFFATLSSAIIFIIAQLNSIVPNIPAIIGFFMLALVSWLSSRNLEQALKELREINVNLDQLVKERTHALAEALTRVRIEAGLNKAILESIADGVVVFDTQGSAIQANPALSDLINVPLHDILNSSVNDLVDFSPMNAKNKGALAGLLTRPGQQLSSHRVEWGKKTISVSSGQVTDRDGSALGTVAVFRDFTAEAELEKMKSTFVAMVSHELRTPLSAILGYAEIFKEKIYGPLNKKQANMTGRIISNSRRLLNLINDLLDQAQMEAGKLKIRYETIKPSDLLENLHSVMDKITADKGLIFTSELDESMPETLVGDSARLQQILVNLVNNSVKFTKAGSIHAQLSKLDTKYWGITVTDTGQGIPEEELPKIFEAFRQVKGTIIGEHGGAGLGLSIVKQLVKLMGGTISAESEVGKGSAFSISLPIEVEKIKEKS